MTDARVSCRRCGAPVAVTGASLRAQLVTCTACDTVHRLTPEGQRVLAGTPPPRSPPEGVRLDERPGALAVRVRKPPGTLPWRQRDVVVGLLAFPVWFLGGLTLDGDVLVTAVTALLGAAAMAAVTASVGWDLPTLWLEPDVLRPTRLFGRPVPLARLRQLYVTRRRDRRGRFDLFALTVDGHRERLLGPMGSGAAAVWVESALEARLDLFQLPVQGAADAAARGAGSPATDVQAPARLSCSACGDGCDVDAVAARRGWAPCDACGNLLLVWPVDDRPLVGLGRPGAARRYEVRRGDVVEVWPLPGVHHVLTGIGDLGRGVTARWRGALAVGLGLLPAMGLAVALPEPVRALGALVVTLVAAVLVVLGVLAGVLTLPSRPVVCADRTGLREVYRPVPAPWRGWVVPAGDLDCVVVRAGGLDGATRWQRGAEALGWSDLAVADRAPVLDVVARGRDGRERVVVASLRSVAEAFEVASALREGLGR